MNEKATPTPWDYNALTQSIGGRDEDGRWVCIANLRWAQSAPGVMVSPDANGLLIERAVNCHDELVAVAEHILVRGHYDTCLKALGEEYDCTCPFAGAEAALAKVKKEARHG